MDYEDEDDNEDDNEDRDVHVFMEIPSSSSKGRCSSDISDDQVGGDFGGWDDGGDKGHLFVVLEKTLREATLSIFVTSFTTSAAYLSTVSSAMPALKVTSTVPLPMNR